MVAKQLREIGGAAELEHGLKCDLYGDLDDKCLPKWVESRMEIDLKARSLPV